MGSIARRSWSSLLRGDTLPGCVPLHGPMPVATSTQDPLGYASDPQVQPWPYDPRLALALAEAGRRELAAGSKDQTAVLPSTSGSGAGGAAASDKLPSTSGRGAGGEGSLVLAFPSDDIAYIACTAIRQQLAAADIVVELKELPAAPGRVPVDVDLLYVELAMWEPLVDAPRVLGENGLAGACSAQMSEALRQLQQAVEWNDVPARLRRIDRLAHDEIAIVPLWQLPDYFAYRKERHGHRTGDADLVSKRRTVEAGIPVPERKMMLQDIPSDGTASGPAHRSCNKLAIVNGPATCLCPGGAFENSPAIYRWERSSSMAFQSRRDG